MGKILETLIENEMRSSYIDYAMSVIVGRALPDVRDGLKPVQRRILYAMRELNLTPQRPFRKSATVVGEVIGKYHPHGDMAVYDALVRMAQNFSLRYPIIQGQGNFGSIDGDPPAAYRYTETKLSNIAMELLEGLDEDMVDFVPNFDERLKEPVVLPAKFPNLILNGSSGIAVGMATNIPPHNINEVITALTALIDKPDTEDAELFRYIQGPDFPTGGEILGRSGILEGYKTGKGKFILRSKVDFEMEKGKPTRIVITEIPYQVSKSLIIEKIANLVKGKKIDGISDLRDESDREGLRIVIEVKRNFQEQVILNQLMKHTPLQIVYGMILLALVDGEPKILSLREILKLYLKHREEVTERKIRFRLKEAEERLHLVEGLLKALGNIDQVIAIVRNSEDVATAKERLIKELEITETQAKYVLEMRIQSLTHLEHSKVREESEKLKRAIREYQTILKDRNLLMSAIREELQTLRGKYGDKRRTLIREEEPEDIDIEDLIPQEDVVVTITNEGYIKRTPIRNYRQQARGGVGKSGISFYEEDFPTHIVISNTHQFLLFLTSKGRAFSLKTYNIQEGGLGAKGRHIKTLVRIRPDEHITGVIPFEKIDPSLYVFMATSKGKIKRTRLFELRNAGARGVQAIRLREGDQLVGAVLTDGKNELLLAKTDGRAVRFKENNVRVMGRQATGVKGARLKKDTEVATLVRLEEGRKCLVVSERGIGKRIDPEEIRLVKRGSLGVTIQRITNRTGRLVKAAMVKDTDDVILLTRAGSVIRLSVKSVKTLSRVSQGVRLMRLKGGDFIIGMTAIEKSQMGGES